MGLVEFPRPLNTMIRGDISESVNNWTCWKIIIYYRSNFSLSYFSIEKSLFIKELYSGKKWFSISRVSFAVKPQRMVLSASIAA